MATRVPTKIETIGITIKLASINSLVNKTLEELPFPIVISSFNVKRMTTKIIAIINVITDQDSLSRSFLLHKVTPVVLVRQITALPSLKAFPL